MAFKTRKERVPFLTCDFHLFKNSFSKIHCLS
jgi:hypothetical protein